MSTSQPILEPAVLATETKLPRTTMLLYGVGQTGAQIFRDAPAALLPLFMTTMLGVSAWLAGVVVLIPKLWVILCDPIMGAMSDRVKPRVGRRPFLVVGGIVSGLLFVALFALSGFSSPLIAAFAVGCVFFLASTAFSAFSVPYLAIASELSDDPHERTTVLSFRIIFAVVGVILGIGLAQPMVFWFGGDAQAWLQMALIFGAVCAVSMLTTAYGVPRSLAQEGPGSAGDAGLLRQLSVVTANRPFVILTSAFLVQTIAQASGYAVVVFVFLYAIQDINLLLPFIIVMACGSILSQPFWLAFSRRLGKVTAFWVACIGWMLVTVSWLSVGVSDDVLINAPYLGELSSQKALVLLRGIIIGITNSGFSLLTFSLLTDTIEFDRKRHGRVDEGVFSGVFSAIEKLAFALGPLIAGVMLSVYGFKSSVGGAIDQSDSAVTGMVLCYSIVPAVGMALSLMIFTRYPAAYSPEPHGAVS